MAVYRAVASLLAVARAFPYISLTVIVAPLTVCCPPISMPAASDVLSDALPDGDEPDDEDPNGSLSVSIHPDNKEAHNNVRAR
jgi:hypothetical protein